jgi:hypothetical protein
MEVRVPLVKECGSGPGIAGGKWGASLQISPRQKAQPPQNFGILHGSWHAMSKSPHSLRTCLHRPSAAAAARLHVTLAMLSADGGCPRSLPKLIDVPPLLYCGRSRWMREVSVAASRGDSNE